MQAAVAVVLAVAGVVRFDAVDGGDGGGGVQGEVEPTLRRSSGLGGRDWQTSWGFGSS